MTEFEYDLNGYLCGQCRLVFKTPDYTKLYDCCKEITSDEICEICGNKGTLVNGSECCPECSSENIEEVEIRI